MAGRRKKYHTEEELQEANRIKAKRYYKKNRECIKTKNRKRYHDNKK